MRIKDVANVIINIEGRKYFGGGSTSPPEEGGGEGGNKDYHIVITSDSSSNGNASMYVEMSGVEGSYQIYRNETLISSGSNPEDGSVYVPLENLGGKTVGLTINVDRADSLVVNSSWTPDYENSGRTIDVKKFVSNIPHQKFTTWEAALTIPSTLPAYITTLQEMFYNCTKFNSDLSGWDVSRILDISWAFSGCTIFNSDLSGWNVSNIRNMQRTFSGCKMFTSDLSSWDVSKVENFEATFSGAEIFNSDLSMWNTVSANTMREMFRGVKGFTSFVENWNVANVLDMDYMFQPESGYTASIPPQDLSRWCVANILFAQDFTGYEWGGIEPVWGTCPTPPLEVPVEPTEPESPKTPEVINGYMGVYTAGNGTGKAGWGNAFPEGIEPIIAPISTNSLGETVQKCFEAYAEQAYLFLEASNSSNGTNYTPTSSLKVQLVPPQTGGYGARSDSSYGIEEINTLDYDRSITQQGATGYLAIYEDNDNTKPYIGYNSNFTIWFVLPTMNSSGSKREFLVTAYIGMSSIRV